MAGWAVFLLGAVMLSVNSGLIPFALFLLLSTVAGFAALRRGARQMAPVLRTLLLLTAVILAMSLLSIVLFEHGFRDVDNRSRFIALPWIAIWAYALRPRRELLWRGAVVGLFAGLLLSGYQVANGFPRADAWTNAIVFADMTLMLMVLVVLLRPNRQLGWVVAALAAGCITIVFTGSRGVWLGLACLLAVAVLTARWRDLRTRLLVLGCALAAVVVLVLTVPGLTHQLRVGELQHDMQRYETGDVDSSAGARLERLQVAWDALMAHPLTGVGVGHFDDAMTELPECSTGVWSKWCHLGHAHNDFAEWAATQGFPGLALIFLVYGVPLAMFVRLRRRAGRVDFRGPAAAGIVIVVSYVLCGMTQSMFAHQLSTSFFVTAVGVLAGLSLRDIHDGRSGSTIAAPAAD